MLKVSTILTIINWILNYIGISLYVFIFLIIYRCRRDLKNISFLLTCNTCFAAFATCFIISLMIYSNLFNGFLTFNINFCYAWGLFYDVFECGIYHSYCLQAFYRLCRVVFYRKRSLLSYSLYLCLISLQWTWIWILLIPPVIVHWYSRLSTESYCLIPYEYILPEVYHILILYIFPLVCITITYLLITEFMRSSAQASTLVLAVAQRQRNQRDLTVIKRIIVLVTILIILRFPTIIFLIYGVVHGSIYPLTYAIVGIITSICLIFIGLITIQITTQLKGPINEMIFKRTNRIETGRVQINPGLTPSALQPSQ